MYSRWQIAAKYLRYYLTASNGKGHGIHSPFVFDFISNLLNDKTNYKEYHLIENLRSESLKNKNLITIRDFGAGSGIANSPARTMASIVRHSVKSKKYSQLLYRMVRKYKPHTIIELGTSLGFTTSYLALANPGANLITVEGSPAIAAAAQQQFNNLGINNIRLEVGQFDQVLPQIAEEVEEIDFAFIDGNHQYEPTLRYFDFFLQKRSNNSILVFDDIHWSSGMEKAWSEIQRNPAVLCTVDLFFIGIVFFRPEFREKQHFAIRF